VAASIIGLGGRVVLNTSALSDRPTRAEVKQMIVSEAPYVKDQKMILQKLSDATEVQRVVVEQANNNRNEISKLRGEIEKLVTQLQLFIKYQMQAHREDT
jgi:hypothetical protein